MNYDEQEKLLAKIFASTKKKYFQAAEKKEQTEDANGRGLEELMKQMDKK